MLLSQLKKPRKLKSGDRLAKRQLEETFDVTVVEMTHTCADPEFIKHNPKARAADLNAAFADSSIDGIVSTIGGDDSVRLLPYFDFQTIAKNPKVLLGYSDTTVSHFASLKAGVSTFYGPSIMSGFAENGGMHKYLIDSVRQLLFETEPIGAIPQNREGWTVEMLDWSVPQNNSIQRALNPCEGWRFIQGEGVVQGHLLGGCLEVVEWLRETPLWPTQDQWQNAILFLETSESAPPPTAVSAALRVYANEGVLNNLRGILFGRPGGQIDPVQFSAYDDAIKQVVQREQGLSKMPIVTRMDFGHTDPMMTLPMGALAEIDCASQNVSLLEPAVVD